MNWSKAEGIASRCRRAPSAQSQSAGPRPSTCTRYPVIDWVAETFRPGEVLFSLMSQYTPQPGAAGPLARHVTRAEYRAAVRYMENCGIRDGFTQERTSAREEYTPAFDLTGV